MLGLVAFNVMLMTYNTRKNNSGFALFNAATAGFCLAGALVKMGMH